MKAALVLALIVVAGCSPPARPARRSVDPGYGSDPLALVLNDASDPRPLAVSVGPATVWIGRDGGGAGHPAYVLASSGEPLRSVDNPFAFKLRVGGRVVSFRPGQEFSQTHDLQRGSVKTTWSGPGCRVTALCRPDGRGPSIELSLEVQSTEPVQVEWPAYRALDFARVSDTSSGSRFTRTVTFHGEGKSSDHATIEIDGPNEDRQAVNSLLFHVCGGAGDGLGPFGTTEPRYDGRVFWDADAWVFPALAILSPERAKEIVKFRTGPGLKAARDNFLDWAAKAGLKPVPGAVRYPWESDGSGHEAARPDNREEIHVSGAVARMLDQAADLGLADPSVADLVRRQVAAFYLARSTRLPDGKMGLLDVRSPDEYATRVDNDLYTNALAEWCLASARPGESWLGMFRRPRDQRTFLTFDEDRLMGYQQAAALLALWPLQDQICEKEADAMLDRFVGTATPNGPSMTASVESLLLARHGDPDRAYAEWKSGLRRATGRPFLMFSESPKKAQAYFLTGAAGFLDSLLYGFLGLRFDPVEPKGAAWKTKLKRGWLSCTPHLPAAWKRVTVRRMILLGKSYVLTATHDGATLTPLPQTGKK